MLLIPRLQRLKLTRHDQLIVLKIENVADNLVVVDLGQQRVERSIRFGGGG
jgi:hypothetical protein